MKKLQIVRGGLPLVAGTLSSARWDLLGNASELPCDIVEIRLDELGWDGDWLERCQAVEASGLPVLLTIRHRAEGGKWSGPEEQRLDLYRQAINHVSAVDVELRSGLGRTVVELARNSGKCGIVSYHDFVRTPPTAELRAVMMEAQEFASVAKIATMVQHETDLELLRPLLGGEWKVPVCVMGMGAVGAAARVDFAVAGFCLSYGYVDQPAAPGQPSAAELVRGLQAALPAYRRRRTNRLE